MRATNDVFIKLKKLKPVLRLEYGIERMGVFGSYAREEELPDSDVDILVDYEGKLGWRFFKLKNFLEDHLGRKVDLITEGSIRKNWRADILKETKFL